MPIQWHSSADDDQIISYTSVHYADESLSLQYLADKVVYMNADYILSLIHISSYTLSMEDPGRMS